jgi:hypothetical protein
MDSRGVLWGAVVACVAAAALALPSGSDAQTLYRYTDQNGRIYYSDKPIIDLTGRPVDQMTRGGTVVKSTGAALTAEQRANLEAERQKRADADRARKHEERRDLALLATYSSRKEIDDAHAEAVREPEAVIRESEAKLQTALQRRDQLAADLEAGRGKPLELRQKLGTTDAEVKALKELLAGKRRDVQQLNDRYADEKRRYAEIVRAREASLAESRKVVVPGTVAR